MFGSSPLWQDLGRQLLSGRTIALMVSVGTALGVSIYVYRHVSHKKVELKEVGQISRLYIYPIKSCRGISVKSAECTNLGLRNGLLRDRVFILVTSDGMFVTARQENRLLLVVPSFDGEDIVVNAPEMDTLRISLSGLKAQQLGTPIKAKIWGDVVRGYDCGDEIADWFQRFLGKPGFRLLHYKEDLEPRVGLKTAYSQFFKKGDGAVYADLTAYLLLSESSVDDLNTRLATSVSVVNFRPNLVVSGCEPYAEDKWQIVKIGSRVQLRFIKPCPRCIMTTIDPETGIRDKKEPLKTLKSYRKNEENVFKKFLKDTPCFGTGYGTDIEGQVNVGDTVYAAE